MYILNKEKLKVIKMSITIPRNNHCMSAVMTEALEDLKANGSDHFFRLAAISFERYNLVTFVVNGKEQQFSNSVGLKSFVEQWLNKK